MYREHLLGAHLVTCSLLAFEPGQPPQNDFGCVGGAEEQKQNNGCRRRWRRKKDEKRSTGAADGQAGEQAEEQNRLQHVAQRVAFLLHVGMPGHAATAMHDKVWQLAQDRVGTHVVQKAFRQMPQENVAGVLRELHEHVLEACRCPYANYTLQCAIEVSPSCQIAFVVESLLGHEIEIACHRSGCRILCRVLEHFGTEPIAHAIVCNLLNDVPNLLIQVMLHRRIGRTYPYMTSL